MTVRKTYGVICPKCKEDDQLDVSAAVNVRLTPNGSDADEARDGSHEWDDDNLMTCACKWSGTVGQGRAAAEAKPE